MADAFSRFHELGLRCRACCALPVLTGASKIKNEQRRVDHRQAGGVPVDTGADTTNAHGRLMLTVPAGLAGAGGRVFCPTYDPSVLLAANAEDERR